jgi:hypothetical protein
VASKTVNLYTEDNRLCQIVTTFSKGILSMNSLTDQEQYLTVGTSGTNFAIVSSGDTHTFNLPVASATNTGKLSSTDWSTFYEKQDALTNPITGTGADGKVAYFDGTTSITSESSFIYDASTNRLGVNTTVPNATIGANAATDSGYSLLLKNDNANYNGIGFGTDSTYGNLIATEKLGTAPSRNLTLLNQSGYISVTEGGNLGVNVLNPAVAGQGIDIYSSTSAGLRFHTATSGTTVSDGAGINFSAANNLGITNYEAGAIDIVTNGNSGVYIASNGYVGINSASGSYPLEVNGGIRQTSVTSALLKTDSVGLLVAAVAGTDYVAPSALSGYLPLTGGNISGNLTIGSPSSALAQFHIYNASAAATMLVETNSSADYAEIAARNYNSASTAYYRQYSSSASGTDFGVSRGNLTALFSNYASNFVLGTQNGGDLILGTANTRRLTILASNGNVGIGLSNPQRLLEIYSATADSHLRLSGSAPSVSMGESITGSIYQAKFGLATASNQFVTGSVAGDFVINNQTGSTIWGYNSTEKMRLDTSGNLGIGGIARSGYRLNVYDTAPILGIESNTTGNVYLRMLQMGDVVSSMYYNNANSTLIISNNNAGIQFNTSGVSNAFNLSSTGAATFSSSVGVGGTISGNYPLTIRSSVADYTKILDWGTGAGGSWGTMTINTSAPYNTIFNSGGFAFTGGNVGIGTSSPSFPNGAGLVVYASDYPRIQLKNSTTGDASTDGAGLFMVGTDYYISNRETGNMIFENGANSERMRITSGGNVGIGTSSPTDYSGYTTLHINGKSGSNSGVVRITAADGSSGFNMYSVGAAQFNTTSAVPFIFLTQDTERMRITSGGDVKINKQLGIGRDVSGNYPLTLQAPSSDTLFQGFSSNGTYQMDCYEDASGPFHMRNGSCDVYLPRTAGTWVGNSDKTIKENIKLIDNSLEKLMQLNGYTYNLIDDKDNNLVGVIAQEVQEVLPQAVHYSYNKKYDREIYGVEYDALIPLLINSIKEQQAQIEELKELIKSK